MKTSASLQALTRFAFISENKDFFYVLSINADFVCG